MISLQKISNICERFGQARRVAIIDGQVTVTWGDLESWVRRYIAVFATRAYRRVAFLSENRHELVPMASALVTLGKSFVGMDYTSTLSQKLHCIDEIGAGCLVYSEAFSADAAEILARRPLDALRLEDGTTRFSPGIAEPSAVHAGIESISFTSGTTGHPKAVYRTRSFDARRFADLTSMFGFDGEEIFIATLPFYHASVLGWARLFLGLGGTLVISNVADPEAMAVDIFSHDVTALLAAPTTLQALLDAFGRRTAPSRLEFVIVGGKHFPPDLKLRALDSLGPIVHEYYGTTETGVNALATPDDMLAEPESSGRVAPGSDIVTVDALGRPLPECEVGRIAVLSYQNMDGYLNRRPADALSLRGDDYLVTADFGYLRGGRLFLVSRSFASQTGVNLYPVEDRLRRVPGVTDAFALCIGDRRAKVYLAIAPGGDCRQIADAAASLTSGLGVAHLEVMVVERIPYSMSGKVRLDELDAHARAARFDSAR